MNEISVILNVYKRYHTLEKQIDAIKNQSIPIKSENIHVWYNKINAKQLIPKDKKIKTYKSNWNTKFYGRFMIPLICKTPFISLFDDDVLPGIDWHKNCMDTMKCVNGILGTSGVILHDDSYHPSKYGWSGNNNDKAIKVDLVGHAWFFRQEWGKFIWDEKPVSWDNGEDIMFSYLAQKHGIDTFVPPHPTGNTKLWGNDATTNWGSDENATYKTSNHYQLRSKIVKKLIEKGWKRVLAK